MVSIYKSEGRVPKFVRQKLIEECLRTEKKGIIHRNEINVHPQAVREVASFLKMMESYDARQGFPDDDSAAYAQNIARDINDALEQYIGAVKELNSKQPDFKDQQARILNQFTNACDKTFKDNLKGMCTKPSVKNFFKDIINSIYKCFDKEPPFKLEGTSISSDQQAGLKDKLGDIRNKGIASDEIDETLGETDSFRPG